jgi:subtilisin family serine protease
MRRVARGGRAIGPILVYFGIASCADVDSPVTAPTRIRPAASRGVNGPAKGDTIADEYIVVLKAGTEEVRGLAKKLVDAASGNLKFTYSSALRGFSARIPEQALPALQHNPVVDRVVPNRVVSIEETQTSVASWGLDRIDQSGLPLSGSYSYGLNGTGVNAYIIDTGIRSTHVEFGLGRVVPAFTAIDDGFGPEDCQGHGTHVAGTVGGKTVGVAKAVTLYSVRVLACNGGGTEAGVIAGVDWVAANAKLPAVANLSLGGGLSDAMNQAIANLTAAGVAVAVAAGNNARDACFFSPAAAPSALTVGATDQTDRQASYSNYGSCLDLYAPGSNITSSWGASDTSYRVLNGTSMATPHVAGAAALYLESNPHASVAAVSDAITSSATKRAVSGIGKGSPNLLVFTGGFWQLPPPPTPPVGNQPPTASFTANCPRGRCSFDGSGSSDDSGITNYRWDFGDGQSVTGSLSKVSHTYAVIGSFTATLTVTDALGQTGNASQIVKIRKN